MGALSNLSNIWLDHRVIHVLVGLTVIFTLSCLADTTPAARASDDAFQGSDQKLPLVKQGIHYYQQNDLEKARKALEIAERIDPDTPAVSYYLGMVYLQQGRREAAIEKWKRFVATAPQDNTSQHIHRSITLLLRKAAKSWARMAVAEEAARLKAPVDDQTVAVTTFENLGSDALGPLGKGMAALIIADLSLVKDLKVIEREKLQALLMEMKLGTTGLVTARSAPKVGKLLKAKYMTSGSLIDIQKTDLHMTAVLFDVGQQHHKGTQEVRGALQNFYSLEKEIACGILADLGRDCRHAPPGFTKTHTKSLPALVSYSQGLDYLDAENYEQARSSFQAAVDEDPQFDLARVALLATPVAAMLLMTEAQILSEASSRAPAFSGTTSAVAGSAASATTAGAGGVGMGTSAAIAGGAVVAGGAVAAASSGSTANGDPDPVDPNGVEGQWHGTWINQGQENGSITLQLTVYNNNLGGEARISGFDCLSSGNISGSRDASRVYLSIQSSDASATLNAELDLSAHSMDGTLEITGGDCTGEMLRFTMAKTGGANVYW